MTTTQTREQWLVAAVDRMRPMFTVHEAELPAVRVSVGFPKSRRGKGSTAIGQCWTGKCSADETHEIFISPELVDPARVLDVLAHELAHAAVGVDKGHKAPFVKLARAIGLDGKPTATIAGEGFTTWLAADDTLKRLGEYPHAALNPGNGAGPPKQTTRMIKLECDACGMIVRTTQKWIEGIGTPSCACDGHFHIT